MIFHPLVLHKLVKTGERDKLGNDKTVEQFFKECGGRFSSWTSTEIALDVRGITKTSRKIITTTVLSDLQATDVLYLKDGVSDEPFKINEIKGSDADRWRILVVESYKV